MKIPKDETKGILLTVASTLVAAGTIVLMSGANTNNYIAVGIGTGVLLLGALVFVGRELLKKYL